MQHKKGFTLIELLVVIGIIGLLATLAVVAFSSAQVRSRDAKRVADMKIVVSALASAYQDDPTLMLCGVGCAAISATTRVSDLTICTACPGTDKTTNYTNLKNIKDPKYAGATALCTGAAGSINCDYATNAAPSLTGFSLFFYTEGAASGLGAGAHTSNQNGILQ